MKVPNNTTEEKLLQTIEKVINKTAPRYTFHGYTVDDIKQESFIICMEALDRYDEARPLENFLSANLSNRLKNFVRDNHFVSSTDKERAKILQPAQLDYEEAIIEEDNVEQIHECIDQEYFNHLIDIHLPANMRMEYLKIINGAYVNKQRKTEIINYIKYILTENEYEKV